MAKCRVQGRRRSNKLHGLVLGDRGWNFVDLEKIKAKIQAGETALGIELGSTRIKAVLMTDTIETVATGSFNWENRLENGVWTYDLAEAWQGIQSCYGAMAASVQEKYGIRLEKIGAMGVSAMMHGYLPFNAKDELLVPFRTWRNNITGQAADELTEALGFNIPQRWSIAHLYQAVLNKEPHVPEISFFTTLAGYIHWQLCGEKVLGIGDASGMFPVDEAAGSYDAGMLAKFDSLEKVEKQPWKLADILPGVLPAGRSAGRLTEKGARLLDPAGNLQPGTLLAPPEGDAGTGMVGTNSVRKRTGNISVGTSAFSMNVLEKPLKAVHRDIDIVTTPDGAPVAMVHVNNCSSDINAWAGLFGEFAAALGVETAPDKLYSVLFNQVRQAEPDAGGLTNYSFLSGENITATQEGRPLFVRTPHSRMNLPNFMLAQLYSAFAALKIGMDVLINEENVRTDVMLAQGGLFKTPVIGQQVLANALEIPITIMDSAGEGGPWGMAVLAVYAGFHKDGMDLADFLDEKVFKGASATTVQPQPEGVAGCRRFIQRFRSGIAVENAAGQAIADEG
ncbi:MAG: FGGY-family carbohydrate kinase [Selenomonadaceae bacterium]|nr:FGGY-family carbohydrate kinase [Selenomonadaceae bacterium]